MPAKINRQYHIITIGCQMNKVDSERLAAFLESRGFKETADPKRSGVIIFNTCGVRQSAEDRVYGLINTLARLNPRAKIVVTGCLSRREDVIKRLAGRVDIFLPINEMPRLPELLAGEELKPHFSLDEVRLQQGEKYLDIRPKHESRFSAYVPIGNGCNNFCAYCVVPYARGREVYRPAKDIIKEVRGLLKGGYKEIVLIAQNVNSYKDKDYDFPKLLKILVKIPGKFWLRFSSSHPKDISPALIKIIGASEKICAHLHLAVQAGDDAILQAMRRRYTVKKYSALIAAVRRARPGIAITTDVIVGFPGETKKQFAGTVKLFKDLKFALAYIAQYSPRPGTLSCKMLDNVSHQEKKRRATILNDILKKTALGDNRPYVGKTAEVLLEGKNKKGKYYGKTSSYKVVLIDDLKNKNGGRNKDGLIGKFVPVKITAAHEFGLDGVFVK